MADAATPAECLSDNRHPIERVEGALTFLASRPWLLVFVALCVNALHRPYLGIVHDARLYAVQTVNRATEGAFSHDLFLAYGSQDRYSFFSPVAGTLTKWLGVDPAFFLVYLVSIVLFLSGIMRVFLALFGSNSWTAVSVLVLSMAWVTYGGMDIFHVNEPFTTPRLPACGLVLWGISFLLRGSYFPALGFMLFALTVHPLMASVGLVLIPGWILITLSPLWGFRLLLLSGILGLLVVAGIAPLGYALFGRMDAEWMERVFLVSPFNFTLEWEYHVWLHLALTVGIVLTNAAFWETENPTTARFLRMVALAGILGILATTVAGVYGYTFLLQAQPYRMVWILHVLAIPCGVDLVRRHWMGSNEYRRVGSVVAFGLLLVTGFQLVNVAVALGLFLVVAVALRGLSSQPRQPHWCLPAVVAGFTLFPLLGLTGIAGQVLSSGDVVIPAHFLYCMIASSVGIPLFLGGLLALLGRFGESFRKMPRRAAALVLMLALGFQCAVFLQANSTLYFGKKAPTHENDQVLHQVLAQWDASSRAPTVFWPTVTFEGMTLRFHACSYLEFTQMSGILFSRQTGIESGRRCRLAGPLLRAETVKLPYHPYVQRALDRLTGLEKSEAVWKQEDLVNLACDPVLDFVVLSRDLGLPYAGTNGKIFVYDCHRLRSQLSAQAQR